MCIIKHLFHEKLSSYILNIIMTSQSLSNLTGLLAALYKVLTMILTSLLSSECSRTWVLMDQMLNKPQLAIVYCYIRFVIGQFSQSIYHGRGFDSNASEMTTVEHISTRI